VPDKLEEAREALAEAAKDATAPIRRKNELLTDPQDDIDRYRERISRVRYTDDDPLELCKGE
jgi:transglutaminase-like putative cysteine protease